MSRRLPVAAGLLLFQFDLVVHGQSSTHDRERQLDLLMQQMLGGLTDSKPPAAGGSASLPLMPAVEVGVQFGSDDAAVTEAEAGSDVSLQTGLGLMTPGLGLMTQQSSQSSHHAREKRLDDLFNSLINEYPNDAAARDYRKKHPSEQAPEEAPRALFVDPVAKDLAAPLTIADYMNQETAIEKKVDAEVSKVNDILQGALHHDTNAVQQQRVNEFNSMQGGASQIQSSISDMNAKLQKTLDEEAQQMQAFIKHALGQDAPSAAPGGIWAEGVQEVAKLEETAERDWENFPGSDLNRNHGRFLTFIIVFMIIAGYLLKYTDVSEGLLAKMGMFIKPRDGGRVLSEFELASGGSSGFSRNSRASAGRVMAPWRPAFVANRDIDQLL